MPKDTNSYGKTGKNGIRPVSVINTWKNPKCKLVEPCFKLQAHVEPLLSLPGVHWCWFPMSFGPSNKTMTSSGLKLGKFPFQAFLLSSNPVMLQHVKLNRSILIFWLFMLFLLFAFQQISNIPPLQAWIEQTKCSLAWRPHRWWIREGNQSTDNFSRPHGHLCI